MSRGKHLSLEEARQQNKLAQFAKEHPSEAEQERFIALLEAMSQGVLEGEETGPQGHAEGSNATRTRPNT